MQPIVVKACKNTRLHTLALDWHNMRHSFSYANRVRWHVK